MVAGGNTKSIKLIRHNFWSPEIIANEGERFGDQ